MADDRNNPNQPRNTGDEGGQGQQSPARNPSEGQSTGQRGGDQGPGKDQGLGKGQQGNRELNEGGFEKGGQVGQEGRENR
ncbi:MAG TPA: hypothetical protein VGW36_02090 [Pyrinomonadaceae bacterium]|nr:hypothetical protein [Pyrinomonadaceae bacterium]